MYLKDQDSNLSIINESNVEIQCHIEVPIPEKISLHFQLSFNTVIR